MPDKDGRVYVMDFGIARSLEHPGMTQTGALMGTPEYMSPEQAKGEKVDARSDLFALGIIFYEMLTGISPFKADTAMAMMFKRTQERPLLSSQLNLGVPRGHQRHRFEVSGDQDRRALPIRARNHQRSRSLERRRSAQHDRPDFAPHPLCTLLSNMAGSRRRHRSCSPVGVYVFRDKFSLRSSPGNPPPSRSQFHSRSCRFTMLHGRVARLAWPELWPTCSARMWASPRTCAPFLPIAFIRCLRICVSPRMPTSIRTRCRHIAEFSNADILVWGQYAKFGDQIRIDATLTISDATAASPENRSRQRKRNSRQRWTGLPNSFATTSPFPPMCLKS